MSNVSAPNAFGQKMMVAKHYNWFRKVALLTKIVLSRGKIFSFFFVHTRTYSKKEWHIGNGKNADQHTLILINKGRYFSI